MSNNRARRAIVIGGSLGGLMSANLLLQAGWDVEIFERSGEDLANRGAGIGTHEELFCVLKRIGIDIDPTIGVPVSGRHCLDASGQVVAYWPAPRTMSAWARLYRPLKERFPSTRYHFGMRLVAIEPVVDGVTAVFADGTRHRADLLVGADGFGSTVRSFFSTQASPSYAGYVGWRGLVNEWEMPVDFHRKMFEHYFFCLPEGEIMLCFPVPGKDHSVIPGKRAYTFVWYHPTEEHKGLADLCTDALGVCHGSSIAPPLIRPDVVRQLRESAHAQMAPQMAQMVDLAPQPFFQAIYDLDSPSVVQGRVVLLGDAAFVARPHTGMGVTKAAIDAATLADALQADSDLDSALAQYGKRCGLFGSRAVARGRWCGAHLQAQSTKPRADQTAEELSHGSTIMVLREHGAKISDIADLAPLVQWLH